MAMRTTAMQFTGSTSETSISLLLLTFEQVVSWGHNHCEHGERTLGLSTWQMET